ncbi:hypothetical protein TanjilG_05734 [Lupinus angustifolius]|uniref:Ceramidase n=1 Tax=Lupinus angustifolius TaxID=3871 RepID=A0A4P1R3K8_LUPAN|nr:hypothetical protein TanjilG_05734 [Lupinus angustifolius]
MRTLQLTGTATVTPPPPPPPPTAFVLLPNAPSLWVLSLKGIVSPSIYFARKMKNRTVQQACGVAFSCCILFMLITPRIPQPQKYHDFADKRQFFGIPNTLNVVSNFPFLVIGVIGLTLCQHRNYFKLSMQGEIWGWTCFYVSVIATGFGSSLYHLNPNHDRLVWDRLPMATAFASLIAILIIERVDAKKGTLSIIPLNMAVYTHSTYWLWASAFYPLAMLQETADKVIYACTFHSVSGHTLKHLSAAMVPVLLTIMLAKRSVDPGKLLHVCKVYLNTCSISQTKVEEDAFDLSCAGCEVSQ